MSHVWMCLVTRMNAPCHTYACIMSHIWTRHVTHMHAACRTHMNESCHTYECIMSHIWMSHGTHINESCLTHKRVMSRISTSYTMHKSCHTHTHEHIRTCINIYKYKYKCINEVFKHMQDCQQNQPKRRVLLSRIQTSQITHVNASCYTCKCVMSHT